MAEWQHNLSWAEVRPFFCKLEGVETVWSDFGTAELQGSFDVVVKSAAERTLHLILAGLNTLRDVHLEMTDMQFSVCEGSCSSELFIIAFLPDGLYFSLRKPTPTATKASTRF